MNRITVKDLFLISSEWIPATELEIKTEGYTIYIGQAHGAVIKYGGRPVKYFYGNTIVID